MKNEVRRRLSLFAVTTLVVAVLVWRARAALTPFAVGLVLSYVLAPVVARVQRLLPPRVRQSRHARFFSVVSVYLVALLVTSVVVAALLPPLIGQATQLLSSFPAFFHRGAAAVTDAMAAYDRALVALTGREELPSQLRQAVRELASADSLRRATLALLAAARGTVAATLGALTTTLSWLLAFIIVPFWMIYVLNDSGRIIDGALSLVPRHLRADIEAVRVMVDRVLGAYIRGQAIIAAIFGSLATLALVALGVPYALLIGMGAGMLNLIPFAGAILGAIAGTVMAFLISPGLALRTFLAFVIIQQIDNLFVTPRVQGESVALHPALIMIVLVLGQQIMGPVGLLVAVPISAVLRDVLHYTYLRVGDDPPSATEALAAVGYPEAIASMRVKPSQARGE